MRANLKELNDAIRDLGAKALDDGGITPGELIEQFRDKYPDLVEEFKDYGFDAFFKNKARGMIKNMSAELTKAYGGEILQGIDEKQLPKMLPIKKKLGDQMSSYWVTRREAGLREIDEFSHDLLENAKACMFRAVDWGDYVGRIKPILEANPDWNVGDAEDYLRREGVDLGPLFGVKEDEVAH